MRAMRARLACRAIGLCTAMLFLFTNTAPAVVTNLRGRVGGGHRSVLTGRVAAPAEPFKELLPSELANVHIPSTLGHVEERFVGEDPRFVLIAQDIHANYEAQNNIAQIMQFLQTGKTRGNFQLMALEGADAQVDPFLFKAMDDEAIRSQLIDYFMKEGSITGAERYLIEAKVPAKGIGVEDADAYMENLDHFRKSHEQKEGIREDLQVVQNFLSKLKPLVFTDELKEMSQKAYEFSESKIQFTDYCALLKEIARRQGVNTESHKNFNLVNQMMDLEQAYDRDKVQDEKTKLVEAIQTKLVKEDAKVLLEKVLLFKLGKISNAEFYGNVLQMAEKCRIDLAAYPNVGKFAESTRLFDQINVADVSKECEEIALKIKETMYKNPEQRDLDQLDMRVATMNRLLDLSLTREELVWYESNSGAWAGEAIANFLQKMSKNYGIPIEITEDIKTISERFLEMHGFYEVAKKRDEIMLEKTLAAMDGEKKKAAVLVVGGFHSKGVSEKLRAKGISYAIVTPRFMQDDSEKVYLSQMLNEETPFAKFLARKGNRLAMLVLWLGSQSQLAKLPENAQKIAAKKALAKIMYASLKASGMPSERMAAEMFKDAVEKLSKGSDASADEKIELGEIEEVDGSKIIKITVGKVHLMVRVGADALQAGIENAQRLVAANVGDKTLTMLPLEEAATALTKTGEFNVDEELVKMESPRAALTFKQRLAQAILGIQEQNQGMDALASANEIAKKHPDLFAEMVSFCGGSPLQAISKIASFMALLAKKAENRKAYANPEVLDELNARIKGTPGERWIIMIDSPVTSHGSGKTTLWAAIQSKDVVLGDMLEEMEFVEGEKELSDWHKAVWADRDVPSEIRKGLITDPEEREKKIDALAAKLAEKDQYKQMMAGYHIGRGVDIRNTIKMILANRKSNDDFTKDFIKAIEDRVVVYIANGSHKFFDENMTQDEGFSAVRVAKLSVSTDAAGARSLSVEYTTPAVSSVPAAASVAKGPSDAVDWSSVQIKGVAGASRKRLFEKIKATGIIEKTLRRLGVEDLGDVGEIQMGSSLGEGSFARPYKITVLSRDKKTTTSFVVKIGKENAQAAFLAKQTARAAMMDLAPEAQEKFQQFAVMPLEIIEQDGVWVSSEEYVEGPADQADETVHFAGERARETGERLGALYLGGWMATGRAFAITDIRPDNAKAKIIDSDFIAMKKWGVEQAETRLADDLRDLLQFLLDPSKSVHYKPGYTAVTEGGRVEEHWLKGKLTPDSAEYSPDFVAGFAAGISKGLQGELTTAEIEEMISDLTRPGPTEEELAAAELRGMELELMQRVLGSFKGVPLPATQAEFGSAATYSAGITGKHAAQTLTEGELTKLSADVEAMPTRALRGKEIEDAQRMFDRVTELKDPAKREQAKAALAALGIDIETIGLDVLEEILRQALEASLDPAGARAPPPVTVKGKTYVLKLHENALHEKTDAFSGPSTDSAKPDTINIAFSAGKIGLIGHEIGEMGQLAHMGPNATELQKRSAHTQAAIVLENFFDGLALDGTLNARNTDQLRSATDEDLRAMIAGTEDAVKEIQSKQAQGGLNAAAAEAAKNRATMLKTAAAEEIRLREGATPQTQVATATAQAQTTGGIGAGDALVMAEGISATPLKSSRTAPTPRKYSRNLANAINRAVLAAAVFFGAFALPMNADTGPSAQATNGLVHARQAVSVQLAAQPAAVDARIADSTRQELERLLKPIDEKLFGQLHYDLKLKTNRKQFDELQNNREVREMLLAALDYGYRVGGLDFRELLTHARHVVIADLDEHFGALAANGLGTIIVSKAALETMMKNGERGIKGMNLTFVHELTHLKDFDEGRMSRSEDISQVAPAEKRARLAEYAFAEKSGEDLSAPEFRALKFQIDHSADDHYRGFVARFISGRSRQDSEAGIRAFPFLADVAKELAAQRKVDDKDIECLSVVLAPQEMESDKKHEAMDVFFRVGNSLYKVHITTDRERGGTSVGMPTEPMSAGEIMSNMFRSGILPEEVQGYADVLGAMVSERIQKKQDTADIRSVFDEMRIKANRTTALKAASRNIITTTAEQWLNTIEEAGPKNVTAEEPPVPVELTPTAPIQKSGIEYRDAMEFRVAIGGFVKTAKLALGLAFVATAKALAAAAVGPATAIGAAPMLLLGGALLTFSIGTYAWKSFPDLKQHIPLLAEMLSFVPRLFAVLGEVARDSVRQFTHSLSKRPVSAGLTAALIGTLSLGESAAVTDGTLHVADGIALTGEKAGMVGPVQLWNTLRATAEKFKPQLHSDQASKDKSPARVAAETFVFNVFSKVGEADSTARGTAFQNLGKELADVLQDPQEIDPLIHQLADAIEIMMNLPLQKGAYDTDDQRQVWKKAMSKLDAIQNNPFYRYLRSRDIEEIPMETDDQSLHSLFLASLPEHLRKEFKNLNISFASPKTYEPLGKPSGYKVTYRRVDRPDIAIAQLQAYVLSHEPADAMMDLKQRVLDSNSGTVMRRSKKAQATAVQTSGDKRSPIAPSSDQADEEAQGDGTARPMSIEEEAQVNRLVSKDGGEFVPQFMGFDEENQSFQVEFLNGKTLDSLLKEGKEFGLETAEGKAKMRQAVFEAFLQWIRKTDGRVIHGDLSPNNVMVVPDESDRGYSVKFIDFGVMKNRQEEGKLSLTQILEKVFTLPYVYSDTDFIYSHSSDKLHFFSIFEGAKAGERPALKDNVFEDFYQALIKVYGEDAARSVVEIELGPKNVMNEKSKRDGTYEAVLQAVNGKLSEGVTEARGVLNRMVDEDSLETLFSTFGVRAGGVEGEIPSGDNYRNYLRELILKFPLQMFHIANAEKQADVQKAKEALLERAAQWAAHVAADQINVFEAINASKADGIDTMYLEVINIAAHAEKLRELLKGQKDGTVSAEAVRKFKADFKQAVQKRLYMQRQSGLFKVALLVPVTDQEKLAKLWEILGFSLNDMQEMGNMFMTTPDAVKDSSGKITMANVVRAAASKIQGLSPRNAAVFTTPEDLQSNWQITRDLIASIINAEGNVALALNVNALVAVLGPQAAEFKAFAVPGKNGQMSVMLYSQEDRDIDSAFESHREAAEKA